MKPFALAAALVLAPLSLAAEPVPDSVEDEGGTLNPEELTLNRVMRDIANGQTSMTNCATGYYITRSGRHEMARELFEKCAADGWTGAMTWMSQLDDNGLGAPENPGAAAEWDRRAADAGDPVGQFNYGLDLMRGRGVPANEAEGRRYVDQAARAGLPTAKRLQAADYDLDEVTPDADEHKYQKMF